MKQIGIKYTSNRFTAVLPLPPRLNEYLNPVGNRLIKSSQFRRYEKDIQKLKTGKPFQNLVAIEMVVYRKRNAGDLDGYFKSLFDSLKGILYLDDSQIKRIIADNEKDADDPRLELVCYEL